MKHSEAQRIHFAGSADPPTSRHAEHNVRARQDQARLCFSQGLCLLVLRSTTSYTTTAELNPTNSSMCPSQQQAHHADSLSSALLDIQRPSWNSGVRENTPQQVSEATATKCFWDVHQEVHACAGSREYDWAIQLTPKCQAFDRIAALYYWPCSWMPNMKLLTSAYWMNRSTTSRIDLLLVRSRCRNFQAPRDRSSEASFRYLGRAVELDFHIET